MSKFYITTSIPYTNDKPHIGFALELIQADVFARFWRRQKDAFFLTGTDEHGLKIYQSARKQNKAPQEFVDEISREFFGLKDLLNISWDDFIRTSDDKRHIPGALRLWNKLAESGDIYKRQYKGLYCIGHEAFVTKKDLVDGKCPAHQKEPEIVEEENYFFRLTKYVDQVRALIEKDELLILPVFRKSEILSLINEGAEDISFSRPKGKVNWGIQVPGDASQLMYVWCDALANYLTGIGYGWDEEKFKAWWPADLHIIGKDILRFHALFWPAMLMSAKISLPKKIFVHGFVSIDGQKISKSLGNVVDPYSLVKKYGIDAVRYYLLRESPSGQDLDFGEHKLENRYKSDLANGLGNFTARVLALGEKIKTIEFDEKDISADILEKIATTKKVVADNIENFELDKALIAIWDLISFGDVYVNEKKPWQANDRKTITELLYVLYNIPEILEPFMPDASKKIKSAFVKSDSGFAVKKIILFKALV